MSLELRQGTYGNYWGNTFNSSNSLNTSQMQVNATYLYTVLTEKGWTLNAIAGILGNMQAESSINPGRWQSDDVGNLNGGYSLVQWTPASKYIDWLPTGADASTMDNAISRILWEVENNQQWIATSSYNYSFEEFTKSTDTPYNLAMAFLANYERPKEPNQPIRGEYANNWYEYLGGIVPPTPTPAPAITKKGFNFIFFKKARQKRNKVV